MEDGNKDKTIMSKVQDLIYQMYYDFKKPNTLFLSREHYYQLEKELWKKMDYHYPYVQNISGIKEVVIDGCKLQIVRIDGEQSFISESIEIK